MFKIEKKEELQKLINWLNEYEITKGCDLFSDFLDLLKEMNDAWTSDGYFSFYQQDAIQKTSGSISVDMWSQYFEGVLSEIRITKKKTQQSCYLQKIHYDCKNLEDIPDEYFKYLLEGLSKRKITIKEDRLCPKYQFSNLPNYRKMTRFANSIYMNEAMALELDMIFETLGINKHPNYVEYGLARILSKMNYNVRIYENRGYIMEVCNAKGIFRDYHIRKFDEVMREISEYYSRNLFGYEFEIGLGALPIEEAMEIVISAFCEKPEIDIDFW